MNLNIQQPLNRMSLHEELLENLRDMIIHGDLDSGEKIPEKELCAQFAVSRTPMREALKVLAAEGLVNLEPNRGARVSSITVRDLEDIFPVLGALEALSGQLACRNITDPELEQIKSLHAQMLEHYERRELHLYFKINQKIHESILATARNHTLSDNYHALSGRVRRARFTSNMTDARWDQAMEEHEEIIVCLENRDGEALASILRNHLKNKLAALRAWLQQQDERKSV